MKSLDFLEQVDHNRKAAIYAAAHDGKMRNFAYHEGLGECRETFSRLLQAVQEGEIGVILTPDAACLAIETSPGWMEAFIQVVQQHEVLIGDHSHDLVYDLREEEDVARFRPSLHTGNTRGRGARRARSSMPSRRVLSRLPPSSGERTGSWSPASRARARTRPSLVFPAGRLGRTWTCLGWDDGKNYWISSPPMGLARRAAGARFPRNEETGSPVRSSKRTRWPRKAPPR